MSQHGSLSQSSQTQSSLFALVPIWDSGEQTLLLSHSRTFRAGRAADCDLVIAHPGVAAWHATLNHDANGVTIHPENGQHVWVNDRLVETDASVALGDTVAIGPATFRVEARRAARRSFAGRPSRAATTGNSVSERLEQQLTELQNQFGAHVAAVPAAAAATENNFSSFAPSFTNPVSDESGLPPQPPGTAQVPGATPFLDFAATTNRRTALDEREGQLNAWHRSLDRRREELDKRSANLTKQQAALATRQTELDHRTAELESWHQAAIEEVESRKVSINAEAEEEMRQRREALKCQEVELRKEQDLVAEQLRRMEESRESIAEQLLTLEEARLEIKAERSELADERTRLETETRAREQADSAQEEVFREQRQKLDEFAQQLEGDRDALRQQEEELRSEQQRLLSRKDDVADAEQRLQLAASQIEDASATVEADAESATAEALILLEQQKQNLAEQQAALQQQLDALSRREDEYQLLRNDIDEQRSQLVEDQVALEFERQEVSTAYAESQQLQQELLDAALDSIDVDEEVEEPDVNLDAEHEALLQREQELNQRTHELASRLADLKAWKRDIESKQLADSQAAVDPPAPVVERPRSVIASKLSSLLMPNGTVPESEPMQDSPGVQDLDAVQAENANLQSERDSLLDRIAELESQLQSAEQESNSLSSLIANSEAAVSGRALTEQNLLADLQALKSELADSHDQAEADSANSGEQVVVNSQVAELEARNQELADAHAEEVQKYRTEIEELNGQLEQVQEQFEDLERRAMQAVASATAAASETAPASAPSEETNSSASDESEPVAGDDNGDSETVARLQQMVEQLSEKLEQRNTTIDNLQAQLNGGIPVDSSVSMTPQEVKVLSQELDHRTVVLDEREAALRERERLLEQAEQELQTQRLALQEARQQLERARVEIQSAREPAASESMLLSRDLIDSVTELAEAGATNSVSLPAQEVVPDQPEEEEDQDALAPQRSSVRSEIAELFGLGKKAKIEEPPVEEKKVSTAAELMEAVDDYSQESAAAVSLSFETAQGLLANPEQSADDGQFDTGTEGTGSDEAEDVVASYMEQLLSRSRAKADGEAPAEVKPDSGPPKKKVDIAKAKEAAKPAQEQTSFIEKYMSGQYSEGEVPEVAEEVEAAELPEDQESKDKSAELRRSKIDKEALRNDLQSFRELSTQSAANALATHARRQQKGGITTRTTILTTLGLVCVFVLSAAIIGVIPFGWLTTLSVVAVIASGAELAFKLKKIQEEVNERTRLAALKPEKEPSRSLGDLEGAAVVAPEADSEAVVSSQADVTTVESVVDEVVSDVTADTSVEIVSDAEPTPEVVVQSAVSEPVELVDRVEPFVPSAVEERVVEASDGESSDAEIKTPEASVLETSIPEQPAADNDGVPDAFDEAFRMLTSTSFPIKKPEGDSGE